MPSAIEARETCSRLGITGFRPGYRRISPLDGRLARQALRARPPEWLRERVPLAECAALSPDLQTPIVLGKPGAGKTTTLFQQLELAQPSNLWLVPALNNLANVQGELAGLEPTREGRREWLERAVASFSS